jgi:hypothetical protein
MENEFISSETFEEPEEKNEPVIDEGEAHFNEGLAEALGEVIPEPIQDEQPADDFSWLKREDFQAIVEKANKVDELSNRYQQLHDKAFGTIGQLKQEINSLKQTRSSAPVSKEAFKEITEYFGDEALSEALAKDLSGLQFGAGTSEINDEAINERIDQAINSRAESLNQEMELKILTLQHPDWKQLKDTTEFQHWRTTLPPEQNNLLSETWDAVTLSSAFASYKLWQGKKSDATQKKQHRLEAAISPTSGGSKFDSEATDYFNQGLNKVLKKQ